MFTLNSESIVAIVRLLVTAAVSICAYFGWALDANLLLNILLTIAAVVILIYTWWKNNNVTSAAQEAQKVLDQIKEAQKAGEITELQATEMINQILSTLGKLSSNQGTEAK